MKQTINIQKILSGDRRSVARVISFVENENEGMEQFLSEIYRHTGGAYLNLTAYVLSGGDRKHAMFK